MTNTYTYNYTGPVEHFTLYKNYNENTCYYTDDSGREWILKESFDEQKKMIESLSEVHRATEKAYLKLKQSDNKQYSHYAYEELVDVCDSLNFLDYDTGYYMGNTNMSQYANASKAWASSHPICVIMRKDGDRRFFRYARRHVEKSKDRELVERAAYEMRQMIEKLNSTSKAAPALGDDTCRELLDLSRKLGEIEKHLKKSANPEK
jgi:hypothetical protein